MTFGSPGRIALAYVVVAALWIGLSDRLLDRSLLDADALSIAHSVKGWLFVLFTGALLYALAARHARRLARARQGEAPRFASADSPAEQALLALRTTLGARHRDTLLHTDRVARVTVGLARRAGVQAQELERIRIGAVLHDVGKIAVPDHILMKPGRLDAEELAQMRRHPELGRELLLQIDALRDFTDIAYCHHERWDGSGYPRGLRGHAIPMGARLLSVVDVWDSLVSRRPYKMPWTERRALAYLRDGVGSQFDPQAVALFLAHYTELKTLAFGAPD
ncbi:HD-GYP domain-containing protein [Frateuria defendens]|uniref:HD-GYP domain-containing protein n=1 Tax=Frateuria defendens TaxID=2219559 RepID=UPI00066FC835|nr:HD domain-containing phosphohydrolase [Frateuria defendens]